MDPRRLVTTAGALAGAAMGLGLVATPAAGEPKPATLRTDEARPYPPPPADDPPQSGRRAIAAANAEARTASRSDRFEGGVQVFAWAPGRVFEVWAAPLRVTTLTLEPGETLLSKAAGDTVRWQLGEVRSGENEALQTHVVLKPLQGGLETNLLLATNRRVYMILLKSGSAEAYNPAVAWRSPEPAGSAPAPLPAPGPAAAEAASATAPATTAAAAEPPRTPLNGRYRIETVGRRTPWTPSAVFDDGRRTFIAFPPDLQVGEAPALFLIAADGEPQLVNYRQSDGLFVVDRLFDRAELRLGDRRPQVVRIRRLSGERR